MVEISWLLLEAAASSSLSRLSLLPFHLSPPFPVCHVFSGLTLSLSLSLSAISFFFSRLPTHNPSLQFQPFSVQTYPIYPIPVSVVVAAFYQSRFLSLLISLFRVKNSNRKRKFGFREDEQLRQLSLQRKEDSMATTRTVEIFTIHRHEEKHLEQQIETGAEEISHLQVRVEELEKTKAELKQSVEELRTEVRERDEMLNFTAKRSEFEDSSEGGDDGCRGGCYSPAAALRFWNVKVSEVVDLVAAEHFMERKGDNVYELGALCGQSNGFSPEFLNSASKFWVKRASLWQV